MMQKFALVFGGSRGIGRACVDALAGDGFDIAYTCTGPAPGVSELNGHLVRAYRADIRDIDQVAQVFASVESDFGERPTCVVANAGINRPPSPLAQFDPGHFGELVDVNLVGAFNVLSHAARCVVDGGSIIAVTTSGIRAALPNVGPYTATKAAVESLVRALARELGSRGVRVNAVAPGPVDTDLFRAGRDEAALQRAAALSPFNRIGRPEEVGHVVAFLASEKASWVHGQVWQPNGGQV
jgi:3-oxoacyl-[acyl-carrier protein] reductase